MKNRTTQDVAHRVAFVARPSPTPSQSSSARMTRCMIVVSVFLLMCLTANATEAIINTPPATCRDKGFSDSLLCSQCEKLLLHLNTRASTSSGQQLVQECRDCCVADAAKDGSHDKPVTFQHARLELCRFHLRNSDIRGFIEDDAIKYKNLKVVFIFDRTPTLILVCTKAVVCLCYRLRYFDCCY